jgi:hypothetical protein
MSHHCHATNCNINVPPEMFMCKRHWFSLPASMRRLIWDNYRSGQCDDMNPSMEYCLIAKRCVEYIAKQEEIEADTKLYDFFLREQEE